MAGLSITAIDVLVAIILLVSAGFAVFRGLIRETFAILEWVAAGYAALRFTPVFRPLLVDYISPPWLEWIAVFIGTFLLVFIPLSILSHRLAEMVKKTEIGPIDRFLGFVFGIGRGLVIVGFAYIAFAALVPLRDHPETLTKARLFPVIRNTSDILRSLVPGIGKANNGEDSQQASARATGPERRSVTKSASESATPKTYGASDRSALDRLFETNGGGKSSR
jgi:membrane protein required for colicin V production